MPASSKARACSAQGNVCKAASTASMNSMQQNRVPMSLCAPFAGTKL